MGTFKRQVTPVISKNQSPRNDMELNERVCQTAVRKRYETEDGTKLKLWTEGRGKTAHVLIELQAPVLRRNKTQN